MTTKECLASTKNMWEVWFCRFGLGGLVWEVWKVRFGRFGRFGLEGLVCEVWFGRFGLGGSFRRFGVGVLVLDVIVFDLCQHCNLMPNRWKKFLLFRTTFHQRYTLGLVDLYRFAQLAVSAVPIIVWSNPCIKKFNRTPIFFSSIPLSFSLNDGKPPNYTHFPSNLFSFQKWNWFKTKTRRTPSALHTASIGGGQFWLWLMCA